MGYLATNLKVLIWKCKGELSNRTYPQYIDHVCRQCGIETEHFRACLLERAIFSSAEVGRLKAFFEDFGYDLSAMEHDFLFDELIRISYKNLTALNLQYLFNAISRGENQDFAETIGVNPSTLTRWKQGTTRPDRESQRRICQYFGYPDAGILKTGFLFLGLEPVSDSQRRQTCKDMIDQLSKEDFEQLYPALIKLLR